MKIWHQNRLKSAEKALYKAYYYHRLFSTDIEIKIIKLISV